jgi:hypothetical protein
MQEPAAMAQRFIPPPPRLFVINTTAVLLLEGLFRLNHRDLLPFTPPKNRKAWVTRDHAKPFW